MAIDIGWIGIVSGTDDGDAVEVKLNDTFQNIEDELNTLEIKSKHGLLLSAFSLASQSPAGLGEANKIQVEFGVAQSTANVSIDVNGNLTFHVAGTYNIRFEAHFGREGSTGASLLAFRVLLNDVQYGNPQVAKIDNADHIQPWADSYTIEAAVNDVMKGELMRVLGSDDSGGLIQTDTTEWGIARSASLQIHKVG
jgi:hypothetical protein